MGFGCNCNEAGAIGSAEGNYLLLETFLEEESVVRVMAVIMKNRSHVVSLNRVFRMFVKAAFVEGRGCVKEGVLLRDKPLRRGGH